MAQNYMGGMALFQERYSFETERDRKQYFAMRDKRPMDEVLRLAERKFNIQCSLSGRTPLKPIIRVFKAQGKPLLVLRVGPKFVSAFTWKRLIHKAAFGPWKVIDETTLGKRWT